MPARPCPSLMWSARGTCDEATPRRGHPARRHGLASTDRVPQPLWSALMLLRSHRGRIRMRRCNDAAVLARAGHECCEVQRLGQRERVLSLRTGTRSRTENSTCQFHAASFELAARAAIEFTRRILDANRPHEPFRPPLLGLTTSGTHLRAEPRPVVTCGWDVRFDTASSFVRLELSVLERSGCLRPALIEGHCRVPHLCHAQPGTTRLMTRCVASRHADQLP